ncbi:MAG TPA: NAD(P)/FAD-dependent oxidoreductase [Rhabdochlamydiaceae bacterium]|jgi:NADH dehydrogenase|nr:NAD(P)/FAD-dependent oxidoreductase [Rhabdochlamydiaceae bacterium]
MINKKVVIVGGGFAGLNVAKKLKKTPFDILLIDKTNHHLFQPLLYEVASAALSPGEIAIPIREILRKQDNITVMMGEIVRIDKKNHHVILGNGEKIGYDYLVLAVGARHSYFGMDEWEKFAPGLKTIKDALTIREEILISFEKAERLDSKAETEKYLNFVIIGGGPTGVEMAGAISEIAQKTMFKNFRRIKPEESKIFLIEAAPRILQTFPEKLSEQAKQGLEKLGVTVITGKRVTNITEEGVQVEETFYPCKNIIWAAGNQASPLLKTLDVPLDRQGRVIVESDLSIPGFPEIFVIGDASTLLGKDGKPLPGVAPVAIQEGRYVASLLKHQLPKGERPPFVYFDKGSLATIGKGKAIAWIGNIQLYGIFAWFMWCFVHIAYLIGFRNRLSVMFEWFIFYLTGQRGARLIYSSVETRLKKL